MTTICIYKDCGQISGFQLSGHAGYAAAGEDIVCAAISSACEMALNVLAELEPAFSCRIEADGGHISAALVPDQPVINPQACQIVFRAFAHKMNALAEEYPQYVSVQLSEVSR